MGIAVPDRLRPAAKILGRYKYVLIVIAVGLALILWPNAPPAEREPERSREGAGEWEESESLERRIEETLSEVSGVGRVSVLLTVKRDMETQYAENTDTKEKRQWAGGALQSYERDSRNAAVMRKDAGGGEQPLVISRIFPVYQGALVVCDGADDIKVRTRVTESVASLTGLGYDKITVVAMKPENGKE
ncbi:MAG: hypothetical protein FWH06_08625 [Oscillospiraceae bacterium]|nr:hypothetical protein [Oscillospiraceae bacterium]